MDVELFPPAVTSFSNRALFQAGVGLDISKLSVSLVILVHLFRFRPKVGTSLALSPQTAPARDETCI